MISTIIYMLITCVPRQNTFCTREYHPVCGNETTYPNLCVAESKGFYGDCEKFLTKGVCSESVTSRITCDDSEFLSEKGFCVKKPWSDFENCQIEKNQGACLHGSDPNPWVAEHCAKTCNSYIKTNRDSDIDI